MLNLINWYYFKGIRSIKQKPVQHPSHPFYLSHLFSYPFHHLQKVELPHLALYFSSYQHNSHKASQGGQAAHIFNLLSSTPHKQPPKTFQHKKLSDKLCIPDSAQSNIGKLLKQVHYILHILAKHQHSSHKHVFLKSPI